LKTPLVSSVGWPSKVHYQVDGSEAVLNQGTVWAIVWTVICGSVMLLFLAIAMHEDRKLQKILAIATTIVWGIGTLLGLGLLVFMFFCRSN